jgi:hypothetical protein
VKCPKPLVIDNRPGGGGNVALQAVARAPADGYTLLMVATPHRRKRLRAAGKFSNVTKLKRIICRHDIPTQDVTVTRVHPAALGMLLLAYPYRGLYAACC